ncbi:MAG: sugar phosphate isomerase/epimerase, partial [Sphingomonadales bacterium]
MDLAIDEIARSGAAFIEPAYIRGYVDFGEDDFAAAPAIRLRRRIADAGLSIHAVSAHMDLSLPDARSMLARRIAFAENLGAKVLITNAGPADHAETVRTVID